MSQQQNLHSFFPILVDEEVVAPPPSPQAPAAVQQAADDDAWETDSYISGLSDASTILIEEADSTVPDSEPEEEEEEVSLFPELESEEEEEEHHMEALHQYEAHNLNMQCSIEGGLVIGAVVHQQLQERLEEGIEILNTLASASDVCVQQCTSEAIDRFREALEAAQGYMD